MRVRVTQLDGKLPNLALMRLAAWHREQGDDVHWRRGVTRQLDEPDYDLVYGSAIFSTTEKAARLFAQQFPGALVGGSGGDSGLRVEDIVPSQFTALDYSGYPDFDASIGYDDRFRHERPDYWKKLKHFQAWIIRGTHKTSSFEAFNASHRPDEPDGGLLELMDSTAA